MNTCFKLKFTFLDKHLFNTLTYVSIFKFSGRQLQFFGIHGQALYQTESFLRACVSLVQERDKYHNGETIAVVYEHTKRTQEMLFIDWAQ